MADIQALFFPELRGLTAAERAGALRCARATAFEVAELLGMALALVLAAAVAGRPWLALLLGAALIAPILLRRLRRGLRRSRGGPQP